MKKATAWLCDFNTIFIFANFRPLLALEFNAVNGPNNDQYSFSIIINHLSLFYPNPLIKSNKERRNKIQITFIIKLRIKPPQPMKEPFFSKSPHGNQSNRHSYNQLKDYTYFDAVTRKYLQTKKRNQAKREQNEQVKQNQQLRQCTFRPILTSQQSYLQVKKTLGNRNPKEEGYAAKKEEAYVRLLNWNNRREVKRRSKIIEKQLTQIAIRQSLSIDKSRHKGSRRKGNHEAKLNQSLEQTFRSQQSSSDQYRSINIIPLISRQEMQEDHGQRATRAANTYFRTFQASKRTK